MSTINGGTRLQLPVRRTAEIVAQELRRQIIDGELADGTLLPGQRHLVKYFNVSLVSLREALRVLEAEGLVSVKRGNQGGAIVHAPVKSSAAYMLGLVLQSGYVRLGDLQMALQELEPSCAALAAHRSDRAKSVVKELKRINKSMGDNLGDGQRFTEIGREFHQAIVRLCGNDTMITVMGSLEALRLSSEKQWEQEVAANGSYPAVTKRRSVLSAHIKLTDAIAAGDAARARALSARHVGETQSAFSSPERANERIRALSPEDMARSRAADLI